MVRPARLRRRTGHDQVCEVARPWPATLTCRRLTPADSRPLRRGRQHDTRARDRRQGQHAYARAYRRPAETFETDLAPLLGPVLAGTTNPDLPDPLRALLTQVGAPEHFTKSLLIGVTVGTMSPVIGGILAPTIQAISNRDRRRIHRSRYSLRSGARRTERNARRHKPVHGGPTVRR